MSDDLTFQDTPLYGWLRQNMWFLLGGVVLVLGILLYREQAPRWKQNNLAASWDAYRTLAPSFTGLEELQRNLAEAKKDSRIHAWFVFDAVQVASERSDAAALAILKPELEALVAEDSVQIAAESGSVGMAKHLLQSAYATAGQLPKSPIAPAPDGRRVEIVLSLDGTSTYTIVIGLYESTAPLGTGALVRWVEAGRLQDQGARRVGSANLTLSLLPETPAEGVEIEKVMVERAFGYFHSEGTLAPGILPGQAGEQDPNNLQLAFQNSYNMDGQTTVLGKVVDGWEGLKTAVETAAPNVAIQVVSARVL